MKIHNSFKGFILLLTAGICIIFLTGCPDTVGSKSTDPVNLPSAPGSFTIYPGNTYATLTWTTPAKDGDSEISGYQVSGGPTVGYSASWVNLSVTGQTILSATLVVQSVFSEPVEEFFAGASGGARARAAWVDVPLSGLFTTSAVIDGLENGVSYTFEVRAVNANGGGLSSGTKTVTPAETGIHQNAPAKPLNFKIDRYNDDGTPILSWTKPNDRGYPIQGYQFAFVEKNEYNEETYNTQWFDMSAWAWMGVEDVVFSGSDKVEWTAYFGWTVQRTHFFQVRAVNAFGGGESSGMLPAISLPDPYYTDRGRPTAPIDPKAVAGNLSVTVTWIIPASNGGSPITGYEYQRNSPNPVLDPDQGFNVKWEAIPGSNSTTTSYTFTGCTADVMHIYTIRAKNANGPGQDSFIINGVYPLNTSGQGGTPQAPKLLKAVPGNGEVKLTWVTPNNTGTPITKYQYQYGISQNNMGPWTDIPDSNHVTESFIMSGLNNGTTYRFAVKAFNSIGGGAESSPVTATPAANMSINPPSAPANFKAVGKNGAVDLVWNLPAQGSGLVTHYQISWGPTATYVRNFTEADQYPESWRSMTINGLTNGTDYTFEIRTKYTTWTGGVGLIGYGEIAKKTAKPVAPPLQTLPTKVIPILGKGYDVTTQYTNSQLIKSPVLNLEKIRQDKLVIQDENIGQGEFVTVQGSTINEYTKDHSSKVNVKVGGGVALIGSFSTDVTHQFSSSRTERNDYSFATSRSNIVTDAWYMDRNTKWLDYLDATFNNDVNSYSVTPQALVAKYGTHVMTGAVLGARLEYSMSAQKKMLTTSEHYGTYVQARARATFLELASASVGVTVEVDNTYKTYYETSSVDSRVFAVGGNPAYGQYIQGSGNYTPWIESINNNTSVWVDYYTDTLVPIWELTSDPYRKSAILNYYSEYTQSKGIIVSTAIRNGGKLLHLGGIKMNASIINGDGEINSKSGGYTKWWLELEISPNHSSFNVSKNAYTGITVNYKYEVQEQGGNKSYLRMQGSQNFATGVYYSVLQGDLYTTLQGTISGEHHEWITVPVNDPLINYLQVKIDGPGKDQDNIGFNAELILKYIERTM